MLAIAYYLLKVIICSGILFGYYWLLLRNKVFHKYNRFYLMASVVLSLLLPLIKINFWSAYQQQQAGVIKVLQVVSYGDEYMDNVIISGQQNSFDAAQLYPFVYLLISLILLAVFLHTLFVIARLLKRYPKQIIDKISFINTDAKSTPFSFLNYIFWNHNIDMETITGNQIFKHELAHVQEGHTYDKLFINIILIFFWCNPFYWLYRKELNMIHEFIADKKAVENSDTEAFAAMILQATYPQHRFQLTNNFFYSPIKRRLVMLTKNKNPKVNYFGRVMVLPLALLIFAAFTFKTKTNGHFYNGKKIIVEKYADANLQGNINLPLFQLDSPPPTVGSFYINGKYSDSAYLKTSEFQSKALCIVDGKEMGNVGINYVKKLGNYSSVTVYNPENAKKEFGEKGKYGVIKLTQKDLAMVIADSVHFDESKNTIKINGNVNLNGNLDNTVIYIDGKIATAQDLNKIAPSTISSVNVIKGERLNEVMETKGKDAIIQVQLKPKDLAEVTVEGYRINPVNKIGIATTTKPLYVINDKIQEDFNMNTIVPNDIERVDILKDKAAIEKYGDKAKDGVIEITTKNKVLTNLTSSGVVEVAVEGKKIQPTYTVKPNSEGVVEVRGYGIEANKTDSVKFQNIDRIFIKTEIEPSYPGGPEAWKTYLKKNLNADIPSDEGWKPGLYTVIVRFIVHTDGSITDVTAMNYEGSKTAQHCIDLIKKSPKWTPAIQNGRVVNAYRRQPITFLIEEVKKPITR